MVNQSVAKITIQIIPFEELIEKTLDAKQEWYDTRYELLYDDYKKEARYADEETVNRWAVNYIRHEMTTYDNELWQIAKKTGNKEAYLRLFELILCKIAEAYPELKEECVSQIQQKMMKSFF